MKYRNYLAAAIFTIGAFGAVTPAQASSILVPTQKQFTKMANIIAHIKVEKTESAWVDGRIITTVTARVVEPLKGVKPTQIITFTVPGGRVGNLEAVSSGTPVVNANEELVVYLEEGNVGRRHLLGQSMGLYRVRYDMGKGQFIATRDISKLGLVAGSPEVNIEKLPRIRELRLSELLTEIRSEIAESKE